MYPHLRIGTAEPTVRSPYPLPRYLPEYSALLRSHGPLERFGELLSSWQRDHTGRYGDWPGWFFDRSGPEGEQVRARTISDDPPGGQAYEVGGWAPALHAVAPEAALRTWVFDELHDDVEAMYDDPPALAEQLLLRGATACAGRGDQSACELRRVWQPVPVRSPLRRGTNRPGAGYTIGRNPRGLGPGHTCWMGDYHA